MGQRGGEGIGAGPGEAEERWRAGAGGTRGGAVGGPETGGAMSWQLVGPAEVGLGGCWEAGGLGPEGGWAGGGGRLRGWGCGGCCAGSGGCWEGDVPLGFSLVSRLVDHALRELISCSRLVGFLGSSFFHFVKSPARMRARFVGDARSTSIMAALRARLFGRRTVCPSRLSRSSAFLGSSTSVTTFLGSSGGAVLNLSLWVRLAVAGGISAGAGGIMSSRSSSSTVSAQLILPPVSMPKGGW
jgi:hypothetical protein